jgi:peptidoglycan/xylan/chitin deacetylase (PgdA/CDA1 family)
VVSGDAFQSDPKVVVRAVLAGVQPGSIIVMHLMGAPNTPATADALATLIPELRARGYEFITLREMLAG